MTVTSQYPIYSPDSQMTAAKRSTVRKSFSTAKLEPAKYELRVRRVTADSKESNILDDVHLADVNEIILDTMSYPNTALLGLKIRLTDQLSGIPKVTYINGGRLIKVYGKSSAGAMEESWHEAASKNPAWVVWDILTNSRYGGAMPSARLDFIAFKNWAAHCDAVGLAWNGVIDSSTNVWDACQLVLRVGHAQLVNVGTRYTVVVEKAATPVMMFSVANMVEGSYKETWLGTTDRANEINVTFFDKEDDYKQRVLKIYDPLALTSGAKQRSSAITLYGVTDHATAYREAQFQLNLNRYILKTVAFSAPLEAVACSVGDLIYVQHDMTEWAVAGRFEAGATTSVANLDRDVTMLDGKQYKLLVMHDAVKRTFGSVYNVAGNSLFLTGYSGSGSVKRIQINGRDLRVAGTFNQGAGYGIIVDDAAGVAPGDTYTLWDTDVIEEYSVVNRPGVSSVLTLQSPMSFAPEQYANWMFGEADKVKNLFRIKSVSGSHEYTRDISAVEYRPEVYDFSRYGGEGINVPIIKPQNGVIGPVRGLQLYEETYVNGESIVTKVVASWRAPSVGMYAGADVYVKKNGGEFYLYGTVTGRTSDNGDAARGDVITVKVVAFDLFGKRSPYELAPEATHKVVGEISGIDVGDVTGADFIWSGRDCKIHWRYNSLTHAYEFGSEPNGADAGALDPQFKDFEVRVYDKTHKILRRTEYVKDNSYVYIYDKNFADGLTRHLVFEIRMRDIFNNLGEPATLEAYNPPPRVISVNQTTSFESATVAYLHSNDPDFAGAQIWLSRNEDDLTNFPPPDDLLVYSGPDLAVLLPNLMFDADYYFRIAAFDAFGPTELIPTATLHFKTTFLNVEAIADGVLKDSQLIPELQKRIDLVDGPATMAGSVSERVLNEAQNRKVAVETAEADLIARIAAEALIRGTAIATIETTINTNDAATASRIDAVSAVTDDNVAAIASETIARTTKDTAIASQVDVVLAKTDANTAAISTETTARIADGEVIASRVDIVEAESGANTVAIATESTARIAADSATATRVDAVVAKTDANTANISTEITARTTADSSLGSRIDVVSATTDGNVAAISTEVMARTAADSAVASRVDVLATMTAENAAAIVTEQTTRTDADSALSSQINAVLATTNANTAAISTETIARTAADSATATQVTTLQSTVGDHTSAIQVAASSIDGLESQYTVKIDNNGHVSGFGLASTTRDGVPTSEFIIRADKFAMVMPSYPDVHPFTIGAVNGVPRVIMSNVLIGDAAITSAKIGDLQVNTLHLAEGTVTVPRFVSASNTVTVTSEWQTILSTSTLSLDSLSVVVLTFDVLYQSAYNPGLGDPGPATVDFRILRNGGIEVSLFQTGGVRSITQDSPGGSAYYEVQVRSLTPYYGTSYVFARTLLALGAKR